MQTESGHTLLDPYTTLPGPGIPLPWRIRSIKAPPSVPYDGLPSTVDPQPPSKRRKANRAISQNEQANIDLHNELRAWLPAAIDEVRQACICSGTLATWYSTSRIARPSLSDGNRASKTVDLVAWGKELEEIRALQEEAVSRSDGVLWLDGE